MKCGVKKRHADVTAIKDNMLIEIHEVGRLRKKNGQPVRRELRVIDDIINSKEFDGAHIYYHDRYSDMKLKIHHFYVTQEDAGLNIYAGTLTRYYAENWERAGKPAGEYVYTLKRVEEEENKEEILDEKEYFAKIQEDVEAWQDSFLKALNKVSQKCYSPWQEDEDTICRWSERESFLTDSEPGYNTQSLAKYAFSIFFQAARYAEENQVSVVIDI